MLKKKDILIMFDKVNFGYEPKKPILHNVSFSINKNEYVCIIGANGCGKSTLAKIIVGLFKPHSGNIYFNNELIKSTNVQKLKKATGIVFENPDSQFINSTVQDEIAFGLENQCIEHHKMQPMIDKIAKNIGINDLLNHEIKKLSGGQKQLVAIASIIVTKPQLIVFDEVTSMLDARAKNRINEIIKWLVKDKHKTVVSITHDMDEAAKADRIIILQNGKIALIGKPHEVFNNKQLSNLSLDKPFAYKIAHALKERG